LAEREGFEPSIRYKRIHTFQACSFSHSDTSPESITILSVNAYQARKFIYGKVFALGKWAADYPFSTGIVSTVKAHVQIKTPPSTYNVDGGVCNPDE
jgi:hypothetical protein